MACSDSTCDGACPYHSGHEEQLQHHESWLRDMKDHAEKTDERVAVIDKGLTQLWTTVKVSVAVGVAVGSASGTVIGLIIAAGK